MITFFKWIGIIFVSMLLLYAVIMFFIFMIFNEAPRTERRVKKEFKNTILTAQVTLNEIEIQAPPLDYFYESENLARIEAQEYLLESDGSFTKDRAVYDEDISREYSILSTDGFSLAYKSGALYDFKNDRIGDEVQGWNGLPFNTVPYLAAINSKYLLIKAHEGDPHKSQLLQVSYPELKIITLTTDPYYTFDRAPLRFESADKTTIVIVYFEGAYSYAYGGDSSRPERSIVRIFNEKNPEGLDLVALSFASGTVVDVAFEDNGLFLTADPSRPAQSDKPRLAPRFWRITITD